MSSRNGSTAMKEEDVEDDDAVVVSSIAIKSRDDETVLFGARGGKHWPQTTTPTSSSDEFGRFWQCQIRIGV